LWVPTFTNGELRNAIGHANKKAAKKAAKKFKQKAGMAIKSAVRSTKRRITRRFSKGVPILKGATNPSTEVVNEKPEEASIQEGISKHVVEGTDPGTNFIPDLTRSQNQSAVTFQVDRESQQGHGHVSADPTANPSVVTLPRSTTGQPTAQNQPAYTDEDKLFTIKDLGSLNRDELRIAATFNYSRIMRYLVLVDDILRALGKLAHAREVGLSRNRLI
jgi:hypothetical protein